MTRRVLVTDKVAVDGLGPLLERDDVEVVEAHDSSGADFQEALAESEALILRSATTVDDSLLEKAPQLRAVGRAGVGVDNIDIDAATKRGIAVFNAPNANTNAAAELTVGLMLAAARNIAPADASVRNKEWERARFKGVELKGKTLGLIGAGRIGSEVALRCQAFGMDVIVYDPYLTEERAAEFGAALVPLNEVLARADFISIHVPLTDETRGIVDAEALMRMKDDAFVVNASRGGVVDELALAGALHSGAIAGAALDVYETEPLAEDNPLRDAPNLILTPHLGASTREAQDGVATEVAQRIAELFETGDTSRALNADRI